MKIRHLLINVTLAVVSILVALFLAELALRATKYKRFVDISPIIPDYMSINKDSSFDIAKNYKPVMYDFKECPYTVWSNELGCFDNTYNGEDYILLVGDSFTWGFAPFEQIYGRIIEKNLNTRVLKCGVFAYGTYQEFLKIKDVISQINKSPRLIIVGYYLGNDLTNDIQFHNNVKSKENDRFRKHIALFDKITEIKTFFKRHSIIFNVINSTKLFFIVKQKLHLEMTNEGDLPFMDTKDKPWLQEGWDMHMGSIMEIKKLADAQGAKLLFALLPLRHQVYKFLQQSSKDWDYPNKRLTAFFTGNDINYIDLTSIFREHAKQTTGSLLDNNTDLYWNYDGHFNLNGHRLAGMFISHYIVQHKIVEVPDYDTIKDNIASQIASFKVSDNTDFINYCK